MPRPRCRITDDDTDASGNASTIASSGAGSGDGGPQPRTRGGYAGFLPAGAVADLNASAASGAGLALMQPVSQPRERDGLLLALALLGLFLSLRNSR